MEVEVEVEVELELQQAPEVGPRVVKGAGRDGRTAWRMRYMRQYSTAGQCAGAAGAGAVQAEQYNHLDSEVQEAGEHHDHGALGSEGVRGDPGPQQVPLPGQCPGDRPALRAPRTILFGKGPPRTNSCFTKKL